MKKQILAKLFNTFIKTLLTIIIFTIFFVFGKNIILPTPEKPIIKKIVENKIPEIKTESKTEQKLEKTNPLVYFNENIKFSPSILTVGGIISWTNFFRAANGLTTLKENPDLNKLALNRLNDMTQKQYFAHISPSGEGVGDIAKNQNYKFILLGENLALGIFKDDEDVVRAWMDSPGHRANILKTLYIEIGIAVQKIIFKEKEVWLAVQVFSVPFSQCSLSNDITLKNIEANKNQIEIISQNLKILLKIIENEEYKTKEELNELAHKYNEMIEGYNSLVLETKNMISTYNQTIQDFNDCIDKYI